MKYLLIGMLLIATKAMAHQDPYGLQTECGPHAIQITDINSCYSFIEAIVDYAETRHIACEHAPSEGRLAQDLAYRDTADWILSHSLRKGEREWEFVLRGVRINFPCQKAMKQ